MTYLLSFCFFFQGYVGMLYKSRQHPLLYGKYTYWTYAELLALLPLIPYFREARHIAIINSFGLGMGIHSFYLTSNYAFMEDSRKRQMGILQYTPVFIVCDALLHWGPFMVLYNTTDFTLLTINYSSAYIGVITGVCHSTYSYFTIYTMNPSILYHIPPNKYNLTQIYSAWILLFSFHVIGSIIIN